MPEFKLNGKTYSGSTNYASAITYTEADGSKTTIQDKISEMDSNISEQNKNLFEVKTIEPTWKIDINSSDIRLVRNGNMAHIKGYFIPTNDVPSSWQTPIATFGDVIFMSGPYCTASGADFAIGNGGLIAISSLKAGTTYKYLDMVCFVK